ncbi:MAG: DUF1822 family protein [Microcoleaceae cyanobacterium]
MKSATMELNQVETGSFLGQDHISLTLRQVNWAADLSQTLADHPRDCWQIYQHALAVIGTVEWLEQRSPELQAQYHWSSRSLQSITLESVHRLQVGQFKLGIIVTESAADPEIYVPRVLLDSVKDPADLYVLVEVLEDLPILSDPEEQAVVSILGFSTQAQWSQNPPEILDDELMIIPTQQFDFNPNRLLLYLRCLEPEAVAAKSPVPATAVSPSVQQTAPVMNVGTWFQNKLDQIAEEFAWILLPPLSYSSAFREQRNPIELLSDAINELKHRAGVVVPLESVRAGYREFVWGEIGLRLYISIWQMDEHLDSPEWTLLLLLAAQSGSRLPQGTQLQVRDECQVLENPTLKDTREDYLYAQVIGAYDELFHVSVHFPDGSAVTLPPFTFASKLQD